MLLRTKEQAYVADDFSRIQVHSRLDGTLLTLADIASVRDGFEENRIDARFNGQPAVMVEVYRVGNQNAIDVADKVKAYVAGAADRFPPGVTLVRFSVAIWVCMGIPIAFAGALALLPWLGVSINIVSLFAFILVLGVVVDDAIVTGENIYTRLEAGEPADKAVVTGTLEVAVPVTFGVLTTVAAFIPLLLIEGARGQIFAQIPLIVIPVLLFSLVESKLILPAHLRHISVRDDGRLTRLQQHVANGLERAIVGVYEPVLAAALRQRYLTLSVFVGVAVIVAAMVRAGHINFVFFPRVQSETARVTLIMPPGTPFEVTEAHIARITEAARAVRDKHKEEDGRGIVKDILSMTGSTGGSGTGNSNLGRVMFELLSPEERTSRITSSEIVREWRERIGAIPGAEAVTFRSEIGRGGSPIQVGLTGNDFAGLDAMAEEVKLRLRQYPGVFDVNDSFEDGKQEMQLRVRPQAALLGIRAEGLARQVREAFFGAQAQRIQRGRDDVRVMVRYPEEQRRSVENLESMYIRTPAGVDVPFSEVAEITVGVSPAVIKRVGRQRVVDVTGDVNKESANMEAVKRDLAAFLTEVSARYPTLRYSLEGEAREQRESFGSLSAGLGFVLFIVYALLAIPFRSYLQPFIVMSVIPFGIVGAILGHMLLGMNLSVLSLMGMLALIGVVVNDSLVLVDYVNRRRAEGHPATVAVRKAGVARFRAVILTSLTTFAGLAPLIFEKATQAQFLIPMAVSLGFGILFATAITLLLVPINYLVLEDLRRLARGTGAVSAGDISGTP